MNLSTKRKLNFFVILIACIIIAFLYTGSNNISDYSEIIGALFFVYGIISAYYLTKVQDTMSNIREQTLIEGSS
ncbi:MAG: hypothetical protein JW791_01125 [Nanoarchaeota archaeon]|nr:hypothetical protein [Nanoarchaeota archaeon]